MEQAAGHGSAPELRIGVLAMQGDFREHVHILRELGVDASELRSVEQLAAVDGLILPGGESTTIARLLLSFGLFEPLRAAIAAGLPVWGTCAGAILLADRAPDLDRPSLGGMDITVRRNAFGRQVDSFEAELTIAAVAGGPVPGVFIRAPVIVATGAGVEVLACLADGRVVACRQGPLLATAFHPELTADRRMHRLFIAMVARALEQGPARQRHASEATA